MQEVKIVINQDILDKYLIYYFEKYPRRKVNHLKPFPPSLNRFTCMKRMAQNALKQSYKEFSMWMASYFQIANLNLDKATIIFAFYFKNHVRRDFDNLLLTPKFLNDGFVNAGVFKDDNGECLKLEFESFKYDKLNPRIEIVIRY